MSVACVYLFMCYYLLGRVLLCVGYFGPLSLMCFYLE